jgi:hypothetical protein
MKRAMNAAGNGIRIRMLTPIARERFWAWIVLYGSIGPKTSYSNMEYINNN